MRNLNIRTIKAVDTNSKFLIECKEMILETDSDSYTINQSDVLFRYLKDKTFIYLL